jgi:hypothetical protein
MATINYQPPIAQTEAQLPSPGVQGLPASSHCNEADIVVLSSGQIAPAAVNVATGIAGIVQQDSNAVFADTTSGNLQGVFGSSQINTGLVPGAPIWVLFLPLGPPITVEINLPATTGWVSGGTNQANVGTAVGLNKDGTTGFYYADDQQTNKVAHIVGKVVGPFKGGVGDLGARVLIAFDVATALALVQGH